MATAGWRERAARNRRYTLPEIREKEIRERHEDYRASSARAYDHVITDEELFEKLGLL